MENSAYGQTEKIISRELWITEDDQIRFRIEAIMLTDQTNREINLIHHLISHKLTTTTTKKIRWKHKFRTCKHASDLQGEKGCDITEMPQTQITHKLVSPHLHRLTEVMKENKNKKRKKN